MKDALREQPLMPLWLEFALAAVFVAAFAAAIAAFFR
jgi:hypothetical protein